MKTLQELVATEDLCWPEIQTMLAEAVQPVEVLPKDVQRADEALLQLQQSTRSWLGAIVYETGGILVDNGWIRILGSGCERMKRSLPVWNMGKAYDSYDEPSPYLLVADDVLGGLFAINGGGLGEDVGSMYYFAPDTLQWEEMELSYSQFLWFCFSGDVAGFYDDFRWKGWEEEVKKLNADEALHIYPPLFSNEFTTVEKADKTSVSMEELFEIEMEMSETFDEEEE